MIAFPSDRIACPLFSVDRTPIVLDCTVWLYVGRKVYLKLQIFCSKTSDQLAIALTTEAWVYEAISSRKSQTPLSIKNHVEKRQLQCLVHSSWCHVSLTNNERRQTRYFWHNDIFMHCTITSDRRFEFRQRKFVIKRSGLLLVAAVVFWKKAFLLEKEHHRTPALLWLNFSQTFMSVCYYVYNDFRRMSCREANIDINKECSLGISLIFTSWLFANIVIWVSTGGRKKINSPNSPVIRRQLMNSFSWIRLLMADQKLYARRDQLSSKYKTSNFETRITMCSCILFVQIALVIVSLKLSVGILHQIGNISTLYHYTLAVLPVGKLCCCGFKFCVPHLQVSKRFNNLNSSHLLDNMVNPF